MGKKFDKIRVSVNGKPTKFRIGDHIRLNKHDMVRCVTQISVDSDGCVQYLLSFLNDGVVSSQWFNENDFEIFGSVDERVKNIGFNP